MNEYKKADDKVIQFKIKNDNINTLIDNEREKLKELSELEKEKIVYCKGVNKCINQLRKSASGDSFNKQLNQLSDDNVADLKSTLNKIDYQRQIIKNNMKKLQEKIEE